MIFCSNNLAETHTTFFGLKRCKENKIGPIILEMDSKMVVDMIVGVCKPSWKLLHWIDKIQNKLKHLNATVVHCFQEANTTANSLLKYGAMKDSSMIFTKSSQMPSMAKGNYLMDKNGMINFRIKSKRKGIC